MTTSFILPTDNAVIDYSIISQIVNAINQQQSEISRIEKVLGITKTTDGTKIVGGVSDPSGTAAQFNISLSGFNTIKSAIAIPFVTSGKATPTCWMTKAPTKDSNGSFNFSFQTNQPVDKIYYIVVGTA
jgi:hypothetical protein